MAFNKSKALESALKFLNQGKVAQAIGEYQQILRHDAQDQATLMTVGDLFARQGDMTRAVEYFERLAQVYLSNGFNSKAIAIYKKIAKLAPNELAPLERLADLYVQQGVLSEARPLFLQIAEAHLKVNKAPKAVEVLHRLLDVEPDNPRVQMRLAELYNLMGQKKEAAQTYANYAQRLFDRGETDEARKLADRALEFEANPATLLLKARAVAMGPHPELAIPILESHPEANAGGDVTNMILDLDLKCGQIPKAMDLARRQMARGASHCLALHSVVESLLAGGQAAEAFALLRELRDPMIEAGEQEKFQKSLSAVSERLPANLDVLEMNADFCRTTSDSFGLPGALSKLADAYAAAGKFDRAEALLQELIERNKDDERLIERLNRLRARASGTPMPEPVVELEPELGVEPAREPVALADRAAIVEPGESALGDASSEAAGIAAGEPLDDETQAYISQALTDVDLFSSYGLTQKATHLLESVLDRAPRHTPTIERLLDMYLGAANDQRTAELAALLEQIHAQRGDTINAERFAELRQRYDKTPAAAAQAAPEQSVVAASAADVSAPVEAPAQAVPAPAREFEIALAPPEESEPAEPARVEQPIAPAAPPTPVASEGDEVDLSDEWEAMVRQTAKPDAAPEIAPLEQAPVAEEKPAETPAEPEPVEDSSEGQVIELTEEQTAIAPAEEEAAPAQAAEFELELTPKGSALKGPATTEDFLSELAAEIEDMEAPRKGREAHPVAEPVASAAPAAGSNGHSTPAPSAESLNELAGVFEEFRNELGELGEEENEDLETHYNLGIAYREMGLLDEAIGEFQKVANAVQRGKPFPYSMNCSTLLALSFMDKGEPKIASLWYSRALQLPKLDHETILALRYDLGVAQESAGDSSAALDSFRQVYAANIDYRDVAERIAALQKR